MSINKSYNFKVKASTEKLAEVRRFVANNAEKHHYSKQDIEDVRLAVDEAFTNIIKHAYNYDENKKVKIELDIDNEKICVSLFDEGKSFDVTNYKMPDIQQQIKNKKRGGMGVYLINKLMDDVQYLKEGDINEIKMCKKRS
ncbi:MAG: ATP-binding protein [Balneolaceae bacterium]